MIKEVRPLNHVKVNIRKYNIDARFYQYYYVENPMFFVVS